MEDIIIFMSAYDITKFTKSLIPHFEKKQDMKMLLNKYHLRYMLMDDNLITPKGYLKLNTEYDDVKQKTTFSFNVIKENDKIQDFEDIINNTSLCIKLLHAHSVMTDSTYFNIDFFVNMESFQVEINKRLLQIDPIIFSLNKTLMIIYEITEFETGKPLKINEVLGHQGNYNLLTVDHYQYFGDNKINSSNGQISKIIYNTISNLMCEMTGKKFKAENYSFIHNRLVLSNNIDDASQYLCELIGTTELPSIYKNISTTSNYDYYPQDGASVIINVNSDDIDTAMFNGIMLESIKLYIYLFQIVNVDIIKSLNEVMRNNMYLENLFFAQQVPIETQNLLNYVYKTKTFQHKKEAIKLKISYLTTQNEIKKTQNSVLLNILLYIISILGAIGTLDTLEKHLDIPFNCSVTIVISIFIILGFIWVYVEWQRNKH